MTIAPQYTDVLTIAEEVWSSFLGGDYPLIPVEAVEVSGPPTFAVITVSGEWDGMLTLEMPASSAHAVTAAMLGLDESGEAVSSADVADAVGELVNMVGGNVKSLMPGPSSLSLPIVAEGALTPPSDMTDAVHLDLTWGPHPFRVNVYARQG